MVAIAEARIAAQAGLRTRARLEAGAWRRVREIVANAEADVGARRIGVATAPPPASPPASTTGPGGCSSVLGPAAAVATIVGAAAVITGRIAPGTAAGSRLHDIPRRGLRPIPTTPSAA